MHVPAVPPDKRGVRTSRTRGGMRWTLVCAETTAWISVRQNRVVLAPVAGVKLLVRRKLRSGSGNGSDGVNQELVSGEITA